jgi:hypothetical protein
MSKRQRIESAKSELSLDMFAAKRSAKLITIWEMQCTYYRIMVLKIIKPTSSF